MWLFALAVATAAELTYCDDVYSVPGTARYDIAMDARESTAQLFGAAGFAEDTLFPAMAKSHEKADGRGFGSGGFKSMAMFGGLQVASLEKPWACPNGSSVRDLDMYASSFGAGGGFGPVSVFVSTGATAMISWNQTYLRTAGAISMPMVMSMIALASPAWIALDDNVIWQNDPQGIFGDFILGAQVAGGPAGSLSLGLSGTEGPYAAYTNPKAFAVASAAVSKDFQRVPYALLGIRGLPLPGEGAAGKSSLYARQFGHEAAADSPVPLTINARSIHIEQVDLFNGLLDLRFAALIAPDTRLNEARIGIGTSTEDDDGSSSVKFIAGVYDQPDYWFWAVEGGLRPTVVMRSSFSFGGATMGAIVGWNAPEMLRIYPYAVDNFSFQIQTQLTPR